jgi:hypothetical protein
MDGEGRVRFCRLCSLNVYDLSGMTRAEAEGLISKTEGRLCGRMTRRADGTVLTKDCPVGLRALRRRASRAAGAAFAALVSLCSLASGQTKSQKLSCGRGGGVKVERKAAKSDAAKTKEAALSGVVLDTNDAFVPNVDVILTDEATKKEFKATTSDEGAFSLPHVPAGEYTLRVNSPGFVSLAVEHFEVKAGEELSLRASLAVGYTEMGVIVTDERPDYQTSNGTTIIKGKMLTDLPLPPGEEK